MLRWVLAWLALPLSAAAAEGCSKLVVTGNPCLLYTSPSPRD